MVRAFKAIEPHALFFPIVQHRDRVAPCDGSDFVLPRISPTAKKNAEKKNRGKNAPAGKRPPG